MDANVALALAVKLSYSNHAATKMAAWQAQGGELFVPTLWAYEIVSGLRKIVTAGALSTADAQTRFEALLALEIQIVPPSFGIKPARVDVVAENWAKCCLRCPIPGPCRAIERRTMDGRRPVSKWRSNSRGRLGA